MEVRRDTEKMAKLSAELRDALDASNGQVLSLDLVKKAETIGKLAKSVKEMKMSRWYLGSYPP